MEITLDHSVLHVGDWERSNRFYREVLGARVIEGDDGTVYRIGDRQLNLHGPGVDVNIAARIPVAPGGSDLCFRWHGTIEEAAAHLGAYGVAVELGPIATFGARGRGVSLYFRDPDGSLLEFIVYDAP